MNNSLLLSKIIAENDIQKLEQFIKNHLPNNPQHLQRVYKQLQLFSKSFNQIIKNPDKNEVKKQISLTNPQIFEQIKYEHQNRNTSKNLQLKQTVIKKHSSLKNIKPERITQDYFQRNKQQNINKRQQKLIRSLKQKGFRTNPEQLPLGFQIIQKKQLKIAAPLQSNPRVVKTRDSSSMNKCIKRYNINKDFYQNNIEDGLIDGDKYYDRQMKSFLQKKNHSLSQIKRKVQWKLNSKVGNQPSNIQSKLKQTKFRQTTASLPLESNKKKNIFFSTHDPSGNYQRDIKVSLTPEPTTRELIDKCSYLLEEQAVVTGKCLFYQSKKYRDLKSKSSSISDKCKQMYNRLQYGTDDRNLQAKGLFNRGDMISKYSLSYIKAIKSNNKSSMILNNKNDLIKNQFKFRNLIAQRNN